MPTVHIPPALRPLTGQIQTIDVAGTTVRELVDSLDREFPGMERKLCQDGQLRPEFSVAINSRISSDRGLLEEVPKSAEVHFLPAISGG